MIDMNSVEPGIEIVSTPHPDGIGTRLEAVETHYVEIIAMVDGRQYYRSTHLIEARTPADDIVDWWRPSEKVAEIFRTAATQLRPEDPNG